MRMFSVTKQKGGHTTGVTTLLSPKTPTPLHCPIPTALYHVLVSPAETWRLPVPLFFTMATCYPNGNEGVLLSIIHSNSTSTATVAKKRIKHGLLLSGDLMSCEMTKYEKTGD